MQFDFKVTCWERITVDKQYEAQILAGIQAGTIKSSTNIYDLLNGENAEVEILVETTQQISLEENNYSSTIEVIGDDGDTLFTNAK